jgi:hypothetical protein
MIPFIFVRSVVLCCGLGHKHEMRMPPIVLEAHFKVFHAPLNHNMNQMTSWPNNGPRKHPSGMHIFCALAHSLVRVYLGSFHIPDYNLLAQTVNSRRMARHRALQITPLLA